MELIYLYFLYATIVSIASTVILLRPAMRDTLMTKDMRLLYYFVFMVLTALTAPLAMLCLFSEERRLEAGLRLKESLFAV